MQASPSYKSKELRLTDLGLRQTASQAPLSTSHIKSYTVGSSLSGGFEQLQRHGDPTSTNQRIGHDVSYIRPPGIHGPDRSIGNPHLSSAMLTRL